MDALAWTVGIGFTSLCNMKCPFCYSQDQRAAQDLPLDVWLSFIRRSASSIRAINYGTGENTLSKDWYPFIEFVRARYPEIKQALTTNGYLARAIEDAGRRAAIDDGIDEIDVSLDFASPQAHDKRRGLSGAFDMAVDTLYYCRAHGKRATIVVLGEAETLDLANLAQLFELARRHGAFVRINLYRHVSPRSPFRPPSPDRVIEALDWIVARHAVVSISEPVFRSLYCLPTARRGDALSSMRILPSGNITPSTYLITDEWVAGNIQNDVVLDDVYRTTPFQRFLQDTIPQQCADCLYLDTCRGGTRDRRFLTWGSLERPDIYCPHAITSLAEAEGRPTARLLRNSETVHSDYLPTMIFAPTSQEGEHVLG